MPTRLRPDRKPEVSFDPTLELSPFVLYRRLKEGLELDVFDVRDCPAGYEIAGSRPWPGSGFRPSGERDVVLVDEDGSVAVELAATLQEAGYERVRALFGGLDLYAFALDPDVVGGETFLTPISGDDQAG